jgi:hypothetical protein
MAFALLLKEELDKRTFPEDLVAPLLRYIRNPKASTFSDSLLFETLRKYDVGAESIPQLKDLPVGSQFGIGKKIFSKGDLRRTRYVCKELNSGKLYLVHKNAEIIPFEMP